MTDFPERYAQAASDAQALCDTIEAAWAAAQDVGAGS